MKTNITDILLFAITTVVICYQMITSLLVVLYTAWTKIKIIFAIDRWPLLFLTASLFCTFHFLSISANSFFSAVCFSLSVLTVCEIHYIIEIFGKKLKFWLKMKQIFKQCLLYCKLFEVETFQLKISRIFKKAVWVSLVRELSESIWAIGATHPSFQAKTGQVMRWAGWLF